MQWVLPSIDPAFREACYATLHPRIRARLWTVDNSDVNLGVSASWNQGIDVARDVDADWLVILSESIRFGASGGTDFEDALTGDWVLATCDQTCTLVTDSGAGFCQGGYGWHLTALARTLIDRVGYFDETFYPAWFEDSDYTYRMTLTGVTRGVRLDGIDAHLAACEHSTAAGLVTGTFYTTRPLYDTKWGGPPGHETYTHPYGDLTIPATAVTRVARR